MTREQAIAIIRQEYLCVDRDCNIEKNCGKCDLAMPSKEPILEAYKMAIETLEQEPYDAVSRKEVMNMLHNHAFDYATSTKISALLKTMRGEVDRIPPVTPAEKPSKCMAPDVLNHWIGTEVLNKIQAELYANAELHEDGDYYLREEWIGEIFDKYKPGK